MKIQNISFTLKDSRQALIRSPQEEDIPEILDYLRLSAGETDFLLRYPEERDQYTPEREKVLFDRVNAADNEAMLVCLVEGKLASNCNIGWSKKAKTRHRASVGIALLKEYWNQGIGTRLFQELIRIAQNNPDIMQMELAYIEGNNCARALYEKMGFRITGM